MEPNTINAHDDNSWLNNFLDTHGPSDDALEDSVFSLLDNPTDLTNLPDLTDLTHTHGPSDNSVFSILDNRINTDFASSLPNRTSAQQPQEITARRVSSKEGLSFLKQTIKQIQETHRETPLTKTQATREIIRIAQEKGFGAYTEEINGKNTAAYFNVSKNTYYKVVSGAFGSSRKRTIVEVTMPTNNIEHSYYNDRTTIKKRVWINSRRGIAALTPIYELIKDTLEYAHTQNIKFSSPAKLGNYIIDRMQINKDSREESYLKALIRYFNVKTQDEKGLYQICDTLKRNTRKLIKAFNSQLGRNLNWSPNNIAEISQRLSPSTQVNTAEAIDNLRYDDEHLDASWLNSSDIDFIDSLV